MSLGPTHHGYFYQDLITAVALVDLLLGGAAVITVDTKGHDSDRFDDVNITYADSTRLRLQIKHTTTDRLLSKETFSQDGRNLKLNKLLDSLLTDLGSFPSTTYRVVVRDKEPDGDLAEVLKRSETSDRVGDPLPGITSEKYQFDPEALRTSKPWTELVKHLDDDDLRRACGSLIIDTSAPSSSINFADPGPAERALVRRVREELGAGRPPNVGVSPEFVAYALVQAATAARVVETGVVRRDLIEPRLGLRTDFGAVEAGHPIEADVAVSRDGAALTVSGQIDEAARFGGRVIVVGEPGAGKSWLCEELTSWYEEREWIVARHHCWLGPADHNLQERVLAEVVVGSLLDQIGTVAPEAVSDLRPRFATSIDALTRSLERCREAQPNKPILLVVDGLDHVDRVVGRSTTHGKAPSAVLVEALAELTLPPGACLVIASQPGAHLQPATPASGPIHVPPMSRDEIQALAMKHGLLESPEGSKLVDSSTRDIIVNLIHRRSNGNALYATYLCRFALGASPLDEMGLPLSVNELIDRLEKVPSAAATVEEYYDYLRGAMTRDESFAVDTLALCSFSLTPDELAEIVGPAIKSFVLPALHRLAPILNVQPGLGGLRLHHESFSRYILRSIDDETAASIRENIAKWLENRGFLNDSRAFRHLPDLLVSLGQYEKLISLVGPRFVAEGVQQFHSPEALGRVLLVVSRAAEARLDWPTLVTCIELRRAIATYEIEALSDAVSEYADVIVGTLGADAVAERLVYNGRFTFPPRWGLRICDAVDRAGAAAPWSTYVEGWRIQHKAEVASYSSDDDAAHHLALQRGSLRLRAQRGDISEDAIAEIAEYLEGEHDASLAELVGVFGDGLPVDYMPQIAAAMTDSVNAAVTYLTLADLAAAGAIGLPDSGDLARKAWELDPTLDTIRYLSYGIDALAIQESLGITDLGAVLDTVTREILDQKSAPELLVIRWIDLLTLAQAVDPVLVIQTGSKLSGVGFYRAWLRYTVATIGLADAIDAGTSTREAASTAVVLALAELAAEAKPFTGSPRACDLYSIHQLIHTVIERSLVVVQPVDLNSVVSHLISISAGTTTTTNLGGGESGPLTINDALAILARASDHVGSGALHSLLAVVRERRNDDHSEYRQQAAFELEIANICLEAGASSEARECWNRAAELFACYGSHKDITLSEIVTSLEDIEDLSSKRDRLAKLVDLVYLVAQHTDGRETRHYVYEWWELAASLDPIAAARDAANLYLGAIGFEDSRAEAAQIQLLQEHCATADPAALAALRLTSSISWRSPAVDTEILNRLASEDVADPRCSAMLAILASSIAASYDNQPMQYSSDQSKAVADHALIQAVVSLGGASFHPRSTRSAPARTRPLMETDSDQMADPLSLLHWLDANRSPEAPPGRAGVITIARAIDGARFNDAPSPWTIEAATDSIGYRILEATLTNGPEAGIALIDDAAREISTFSQIDIFEGLGQRFALRAEGDEALAAVGSYCFVTAYHRAKGGGWRHFGDRSRRGLWQQAHQLDPFVAERALAAALSDRIAGEHYESYGCAQGLIAAFAVQPAVSARGTAVDCWDAAFEVIRHRLPGAVTSRAHVYKPTALPDTVDDLDVALATLAFAAVCKSSREELRLALLAVEFLLTIRPSTAQAALANVVRKGLDAGRTAWLLDAVRVILPPGALENDLAAELTQLAVCDSLSVRVLAAQILGVHGRPVPGPPATTPLLAVSAAFRRARLVDEEESE